MKAAWILYILIFFNGNLKVEMHEYNTEEKCEQEKIRIAQEVKEVYGIKNVELHCILTLER